MRSFLLYMSLGVLILGGFSRALFAQSKDEADTRKTILQLSTLESKLDDMIDAQKKLLEQQKEVVAEIEDLKIWVNKR